MLKHTKRVRKITYIIGFTSIVLGLISLIVIFIAYQQQKPEPTEIAMPATCKEFVEQIITPAEFKTVIKDVIHTGECASSFLIDPPLNGINQLCTCPIMQLPEIFFQPGDTIVMKAGSPNLTIITPGSKNVITYEYPCCGE